MRLIRRPGSHWPAENRWGTPDNWMGHEPWPAAEEARRGAQVGERVGRLPHKLTRDLSNDVWRWHGIGHDPEFVSVTTAHPKVLHMAEALLGGPIKYPYRNRGLYSIFPRAGDGEPSRLGPHMDANMTELMAVTYVDDVGPGEGGFTVYPGSAQRLYPTSEQAYNWVATEASKQALDDIKAYTQPVEFVGRAGDVIFCHGWVLHSAGVHEGNGIRKAVIQDINRVRPRGHMRWSAAGKQGGARVHGDMDGCLRFACDGDDDPADGLREVTNQWIMDNNEFTADRRTPFDDLFHEWNLGREPVRGHVIKEHPWWERYQLPLLPTGTTPRGGGGMPAVRLDKIAAYEGAGVWQINARPGYHAR